MTKSTKTEVKKYLEDELKNTDFTDRDARNNSYFKTIDTLTAFSNTGDHKTFGSKMLKKCIRMLRELDVDVEQSYKNILSYLKGEKNEIIRNL